MDELPEQALAGGRQTHGIVRVGRTVRRSLHQRSDYVHALLRYLEAVNFERRVCDAYGWDDVGLVVREIGDRSGGYSPRCSSRHST